MNFSLSRNLILPLVACLGLAACGENKIIRGADLSGEIQNGQVMMDLITHLNSQSMQLPLLQIPVYDPNRPAVLLGQLGISSPAVGVTDIALKLNLTVAAKLPSLVPERTLPNGTPFPVNGVKTNNWYSLPLGNSKNSKVYINYDPTTKQTLVGYALASDHLSTGVIANIFMPFQSATVSGYGGVYSSPLAGQSGFAVFANVSSVQTLSFHDSTSVKKQEVLQKKLIDLNLRKTKLRLR